MKIPGLILLILIIVVTGILTSISTKLSFLLLVLLMMTSVILYKKRWLKDGLAFGLLAMILILPQFQLIMSVPFGISSAIIFLSLILFIFRKGHVITDKFYIYSVFSIVAMSFSISNAVDLGRSISYIVLFVASVCIYAMFSNIKIGKEVNFLGNGFFAIWAVFIGFTLLQKFASNIYDAVISLVYPSNVLSAIQAWSYSDRIVGLGIHPGVNALIIVMLVFIVMFYLKQKLLRFIILAVSLYSVILTGNRSILVLFGAFILLFFLLSSMQNENKKNENLIINKIGKGLTMLLAIVGMVYFVINSSIAERFTDSASSESIGSRFELYEFAISLFKENYLVGNGINNFVTYTEQIGGIGYLREVTHAHNIFMQLLAETGIFGLVVFLLVVFLFLKIDYSFCIEALREKKFEKIILVFPSIIFMLNAITGNPTYTETTLLLFMCIRGLIKLEYENKKLPL